MVGWGQLGPRHPRSDSFRTPEVAVRTACCLREPGEGGRKGLPKEWNRLESRLAHRNCSSLPTLPPVLSGRPTGSVLDFPGTSDQIKTDDKPAKRK